MRCECPTGLLGNDNCEVAMLQRLWSTFRGQMPPCAYPPGPRSRYPGALLLAFRRDSLGLLTSVAQEYGDVAHGTLAASISIS